MKALLKNYHQSPRKVRLVADLVRGKRVEDARVSLMFLDKKSALAMRKLLDSAVANARGKGVSVENLKISRISVDKGAVLMRGRPFSRGRSGKIRKTMSIIKLELAEGGPKKVKAPSKKKVTPESNKPTQLAARS